jgi:hypothetical protein
MYPVVQIGEADSVIPFLAEIENRRPIKRDAAQKSSSSWLAQ